MSNKKSYKCLFIAFIFGFYFLPIHAVASYCPQESESGGWWCDYSDDMILLNWYWRATGAHGDPGGNELTRGAWEIADDVRFSTSDNDPTHDTTFAITNNNASGTILYRIQDGGVQRFKDYQVTATISSGDNDRLGIAFYYQTHFNFYRLTIDNDQRPNSSAELPHSIYLTRRVNGYEYTLAIAPWPGTHHKVKEFGTIKLRVKVITGSSNQKYILAQYFNPSIGDYVNLFDEVYIDWNKSINYGYAGVYAAYMGQGPDPDPGPEDDGGRLHYIDVSHIDRIIDIVKANPSPDDSDPYLLDYKDDDGNGVEYVEMKYNQYPTTETSDMMYWFLDDETTFFAKTEPGEHVGIYIPLGPHTVSVYANSDRTGLAGKKEVWVASESAFTIAVLPDLHVGTVDLGTGTKFRDFQVEGIMREIEKRTSEDDIKACIQVGDIAVRGTEAQLTQAAVEYFPLLPADMPIIAAMGNHDYKHDEDEVPGKRNSRYTDRHIFPVVTDSDRVDVAKNQNRTKPGYGVETPNELDNMYYLFDEDDLGDAGSGKWLVLSLQVEPMARDLFWAEKILKRYSNYNVILVTHQFLAENGEIDETVMTTPLFPYSNSAQTIWNFLEKYDHIKLILDGHTSKHSGLCTKTIKRDCGSDVLAIMTDVSYTHAMRGAGGQFRLLEIDPYQDMIRGRLVYAQTHKHIGSAYDDYKLAGQATNATHSDAYFIIRNDGEKVVDLSNNNSSNVLLFEDFNDGSPDGWHSNSPSTWHVDMTNEPGSPDREWLTDVIVKNETDTALRMSKYGRVQESRGPFSCNNDNKFLTGTYYVYEDVDVDPKNNWSDYIFELDLYTGDNDGIGVMFYYTDENNYYRFSMFRQSQCGQGVGYYSLEKVYEDIQGNVKRMVLDSGNEMFEMHTPYKVVVDLSKNGNIKIDIYDILSTSSEDRFLWINENDSEHTKGTIALYSWGMETNPDYQYNKSGAIFDNVLVTKVTGDSTITKFEINNPTSNAALQDGVTFKAKVSENCEPVNMVLFYIREPDGAAGIDIGYENLVAGFNETSGMWELGFDTTQLLDGYYVLLAKAIYESGNEVLSELVPFSIRNWAVVELLPASATYRAGRTMPIKFSLRITESVDPAQPFVYNEDLEIRIYDEEKESLLQTSQYGDTSTDYRINSETEIYITNFKTDRKPAKYSVEIWRPSNNFLIGEFNFETTRK